MESSRLPAKSRSPSPWCLKAKEMLRSNEIQKSFRPELSRQSDEIQLVPLVKEYFRLHGAVMKAVIGMHLPRLMELQRYGQVVLTKTGLPPGAVPVIWEGEDPQRPLPVPDWAARFDHLRRGIAIAREQEALSYQLRATTSLARVLHRRGHQAEAAALVDRVYRALGEGLDSPDRREAAAFIG
jgi:hypothetical protein